MSVHKRCLVRVGDWVRINPVLMATIAYHGSLARVIDLRRPDQGIMVAFPPRHPGHKPLRLSLADGNWNPIEEVVMRLALVSAPTVKDLEKSIDCCHPTQLHPFPS